MIYTGSDFRRLRIERERIKNKRKENIRKKTIFFVFFIGSLLLISFFMTSYAGADNTRLIEYRVDPGDSLWEIAREYKNPDMDIREYIYLIKKTNKLNGSHIVAGQLLMIPVK